MFTAPRRLTGQSIGIITTLIILALGALALVAPAIIPANPNQISSRVLEPPFGHYVLGTDELGRSVLVELIYGLRLSLLIGVLAAAIATSLGLAIGSIAGYFSGWPDIVLMRVAEIFQVMPMFILAALVVALLGAGVSRVIAVIGVLAWPDCARLMRSEVLRVKQLDFVDVARCMGIGEWAIMVREVIPNAVGPIMAIGTLIIGRAILVEASLSFLGLSSPDLVSWGRMLNSGQRFLFQAWWLSVFPGAAIFLTILTFNLFGDTLGRVLSPHEASN